MFVLDSHCDTPSQIHRLRDLSLDNEFAHVDFPKLKKGGVDGAFFALYIPADLDVEAAREYMRCLLDDVRRTVSDNADKVKLTVSHSQALQNKSEGRLSVFLGLENGSPLGDGDEALDMLRSLYDEGVRYMTLCHSRDNQICDSCASANGRWNGLSPFGRELVKEMNTSGMMVDVSHISDAAFYDVLDCSSMPVVATHSCCRALASHPRNMADDMIRELAANGGVIQINFYPAFIDDSFASDEFSELADDFDAKQFASRMEPDNDEKRAAYHEVEKKLANFPAPSYKRVVDHIDHVVKLVGAKHVGLGSDFDGIETPPEGVRDISKFPLFTEELKARGYSDEDIKGISKLDS